MNQFKSTIVLFLFISLSVNTFGQAKANAFEVSKSGQGSKSIIFIPGFSCSGEVWDETKTKFEKDYTCYVLTMAGFADAKPQTNSTFENWETSIANYIKKNKIDKPIIIGHSMGGGLALALASDYPELIEKIIVVDALPCLSALRNPTFKSEEKPDCSAMINQISSATNEQFYQMQKMNIQQLVADTSKQELIVNWSIKSDRKTFAEMYCDFLNTDLREKITAIKCPTLILLEAYFKNVKPAIEEQYKNLKTANLQYSNKGLHFIMYDDKEWYFSQLNNFISTNKMVFEDLYKSYWQKIFRLCMGYINDYDLAQDMAQETFIIVWQQLPKFRNDADISTWIFRIASNNCLRQIEKQKRFLKAALPIDLKEEKDESIEPQIQFLYQCISELRETDRIIISLELENIKQSEIANIVGLSEVNVRVRIYRIKEKLTQKFKENGQ